MLVGPSECAPVVAAIGETAERLVHRYGGCARRRTWDDLAASRTVHDRWTGAAEVRCDDDLRVFADLSLVDELEVAEHDPGALTRYGA